MTIELKYTILIAIITFMVGVLAASVYVEYISVKMWREMKERDDEEA